MAGVVHIGRAAKLAGVSVDTIRFYQRLGLIKSAGRSSGGYRLFDGEQIRDLTFVRHAQELGFSLTEVKELRNQAFRREPTLDVITVSHQDVTKSATFFRSLLPLHYI